MKPIKETHPSLDWNRCQIRTTLRYFGKDVACKKCGGVNFEDRLEKCFPESSIQKHTVDKAVLKQALLDMLPNDKQIIEQSNQCGNSVKLIYAAVTVDVINKLVERLGL